MPNLNACGSTLDVVKYLEFQHERLLKRADMIGELLDIIDKKDQDFKELLNKLYLCGVLFFKD